MNESRILILFLRGVYIYIYICDEKRIFCLLFRIFNQWESLIRSFSMVLDFLGLYIFYPPFFLLFTASFQDL